jgi:hypothetical protein
MPSTAAAHEAPDRQPPAEDTAPERLLRFDPRQWGGTTEQHYATWRGARRAWIADHPEHEATFGDALDILRTEVTEKRRTTPGGS